jgi:hypothetical protein
LFIGSCVYNSCRAGPVGIPVISFNNAWPVHAYRIVIHKGMMRIVTIIYIVYPYRLSRYPPDIFNPWPGYVSCIVVYNISVVNDGSLIDHVNNTGSGYIVIVNVRVANIGLRGTNPVIVRYAVAAAK